MNDLTRPASSAILDHAIADLRTAAGGTGQITTVAAGVTTVWPLDYAEHAVITAVGFSWRDDRSALILETGHGPRLLLLTPAPTRTSRGRAVAAFKAAVPGLHYDLSPSQEAGVEGAYAAGVRAGRESAARDIEATGNYERQARIAREGLRPGEAKCETCNGTGPCPDCPAGTEVPR